MCLFGVLKINMSFASDFNTSLKYKIIHSVEVNPFKDVLQKRLLWRYSKFI